MTVATSGSLPGPYRSIDFEIAPLCLPDGGQDVRCRGFLAGQHPVHVCLQIRSVSRLDLQISCMHCFKEGPISHRCIKCLAKNFQSLVWHIGPTAGVILIVIACVPRVAEIRALMPKAVLGAALLFIACFVLVNGLQTITARMLDVRRTVMVGLAISCGTAAEILPSFVAVFPPAVQPLMGSSLVVGTIIALAFNALFLIGQRKRAVLSISAEEPQVAKKIDDFFLSTGQRWGARKDVISQVIFGVYRRSMLFAIIVSPGKTYPSPPGSMNSAWTSKFCTAAIRSNFRIGVHRKERSLKPRPGFAGSPVICCAATPIACAPTSRMGQPAFIFISIIERFARA